MPFRDLIVPREPYIKIGKVVPRKLAPDGAWDMTEWSEEERIYQERVEENENEDGRNARLEATEDVFDGGHLGRKIGPQTRQSNETETDHRKRSWSSNDKTPPRARCFFTTCRDSTEHSSGDDELHIGFM